MKNNKKAVWLILLIISLVIIFAMWLVSCAMDIGEKLGRIHVSVEIAFYILISLIIVLGIVLPIVHVFCEPVFSLDKLKDTNGRSQSKWCRWLVKELVKSGELSEEEKEQVKGFLRDERHSANNLIVFYNQKIVPKINKEIINSAKKVFVVTAVSQNSALDMIGVLSTNMMLVKKITDICGFRPNTIQLFRIYVRVFSITLFAGVLEEVNIEKLLSLLGPIGSALGVVLSSVIQGATNALTTLHMGVVTKNCLLNADVSLARSELRKKSFEESKAMLLGILKQEVDKVKKPFINIFNHRESTSDISNGGEVKDRNPLVGLFGRKKEST